MAVLNHALRNVPADRVRMHVCWGNYEGPHHRDVEMAVILPTLLTAKPAGLLFETANPRHQHDLEAFAEHRALIADDKVLIPGVIDSTTNFIEHPRVVANRLRGFVDLVGRRAGDRRHRLRVLDVRRVSARSTPTSSTPSWPPWPRARRWEKRAEAQTIRLASRRCSQLRSVRRGCGVARAR